MQFRKAVMQDVDAIWEIEQSVFSSPWSRDQLAHELVANPTAGHWVLDDGNSILGFIMSYIVQYEVQIINIAVRLSHQYRGYGKIILSEFLSRFNEKTYFFRFFIHAQHFFRCPNFRFPLRSLKNCLIEDAYGKWLNEI